MDLNPALVNVYGPGTSGKSNFLKWLLSRPAYRRHVVFDPMREYDEERYNVYRPDNMEYEGGNDELNRFINEVTTLPRPARPRYIVIDEAANYLPGGQKKMGPEASKLAYHNTHTAPGVSLITANRHPTDLNPTIREMYDHMFVFGARGNALDTLESMAKGLREAVEDLPEYHFIHADPRGNLTKYEPVPEMEGYARV